MRLRTCNELPIRDSRVHVILILPTMPGYERRRTTTDAFGRPKDSLHWRPVFTARFLPRKGRKRSAVNASAIN